MATPTTADPSPPLLSAEANSAAVITTTIIPSERREEPKDTLLVANNSSNIPPPSEDLQPLQLPVPQPPHFIDSVTQLKKLSSALVAFHQCYDDLHNHLDSIEAALLSKLAPEKEDIAIVPLSVSPRKELAFVSEEEEVLKQQTEQPRKSELESLCKMMCSRGLRKYLASNLSNLAKLREEVPRALKLAVNPAKLVLECFGKFFLQGSRAYTKNSPMIPAREASISMLECFLLMMDINEHGGVGNGAVEIEKEVKEEAENSAVAWRKRLVTEGGLKKACDIDARGLFLFVSCFGVPASFSKEDMRDMLRASDKNKILAILQKSNVLMDKVSASLEEMLKNKMEVDAVDLAYTFGLQEKFNPQTILVSFLRDSKESCKQARQLAHGGPIALNNANKQQLAALKSIVKCLEKHKIDPANFLSGWQISSKIQSLEKDIAAFNKRPGEKNAQKRRAEDNEPPKKSKTQDVKRGRFTGHGPQHQVTSGRSINYSVSTPVVYGGPGAGMVPEIMLPSGVGAGMSVSPGGLRPTSSHTWNGDAAARYAGQPSSVGITNLYLLPHSFEGFAGLPSASSGGGVGSRGSGADLYQFADSIVESEPYPSSVPHNTSSTPGALPTAYHSSHLY